MKSDQVLTYKGYTAKPEFSASDGIFYGKVLGISDLVDFYSENAKELEKEFHNAVDDYIEFCQEIGKNPEKEYSGTFNVRIQPELHKKASMMAAQQGITLNKFVENCLQESIAEKRTNQEMMKSSIFSSQTKIVDSVDNQNLHTVVSWKMPSKLSYSNARRS